MAGEHQSTRPPIAPILSGYGADQAQVQSAWKATTFSSSFLPSRSRLLMPCHDRPIWWMDLPLGCAAVGSENRHVTRERDSCLYYRRRASSASTAGLQWSGPLIRGGGGPGNGNGGSCSSHACSSKEEREFLTPPLQRRGQPFCPASEQVRKRKTEGDQR